jgi:uroporphyrinogen-III synthase
MKIIAISELSIYNDLKKICHTKKISIKKKIALRIEKINIEDKINNTPITLVDNIIFQSKNAVKYSNAIHEDIAKNPKAKIYCIGKYTKLEVKKLFKNKVIHPEKDYSSEELMRLIKREKEENDSYVVIKGEDGRSYIGDNLIKLGKVVDELNVYRREEMAGFINNSDLSDNENNYVLVSSKTALNVFNKCIKDAHKNIILVVPNQRLIEEVKRNLFGDIIIIANNNAAEDYIKKIQEHNG